MKKFLSTTKGNFRHTPSRFNRLILVLVVGLVILSGWIFPKVISTIVSVVVYPVHSFTLWLETSTDSLPQYWRARQELITTINDLQTRLATESGTQLSVRRLRDENHRLRALLGEAEVGDKLLARVLDRPTRLPYDLIQLDRGSRDGVMEGAVVYVGLDTVIGVVVFVAPTYSLVELVTSPGFSSTAYVLELGVFLPLDGVGGGMARLRAPQGLALEEGQTIILPGVTSGVYGEVASIQNEPTQPEQFAYVASPVGLSELVYVTVAREVFEPASTAQLNETVREAVRSWFVVETELLPDPLLDGQED